MESHGVRSHQHPLHHPFPGLRPDEPGLGGRVQDGPGNLLQHAHDNCFWRCPGGPGGGQLRAGAAADGGHQPAGHRHRALLPLLRPRRRRQHRHQPSTSASKAVDNDLHAHRGWQRAARIKQDSNKAEIHQLLLQEVQVLLQAPDQRSPCNNSLDGLQQVRGLPEGHAGPGRVPAGPGRGDAARGHARLQPGRAAGPAGGPHAPHGVPRHADHGKPKDLAICCQCYFLFGRVCWRSWTDYHSMYPDAFISALCRRLRGLLLRGAARGRRPGGCGGGGRRGGGRPGSGPRRGGAWKQGVNGSRIWRRTTKY
mmetsp:Transcript_4099/g.6662  ORF Transcript_4099/g.6662 Transcript_4099/m.6662 type:complete len:310 (+) Transcript_4099:329-1258(+)